MSELSISDHHLLSIGQSVDLQAIAGTLALDGEREIELRGNERIEVILSGNGPLVVNIDRAIGAAARFGFFNR